VGRLRLDLFGILAWSIIIMVLAMKLCARVAGQASDNTASSSL